MVLLGVAVGIRDGMPSHVIDALVLVKVAQDQEFFCPGLFCTSNAFPILNVSCVSNRLLFWDTSCGHFWTWK
jgi:hypothetical protein